MFKFVVKMGIATAAVYYIKEQDVWKSSNESVKTLERFKVICKPYVLEAKKQIPMELPEVPETSRVSTIVKESWNAGILTTFRFIANIPETLGVWSSEGIDAALQNPEIKKFMESFSNNNAK